MNTDYLQCGDVFVGYVGMTVYADVVQWRDVWVNVDSDTKKKIREQYSINTETRITDEISGEYLVISAKCDGGSSGRDAYPDGWHVIAQKLSNGQYDPNGHKIRFYQSGSFTIVHDHSIPVIRKMHKEVKWVVESSER